MKDMGPIDVVILTNHMWKSESYPVDSIIVVWSKVSSEKEVSHVLTGVLLSHHHLPACPITVPPGSETFCSATPYLFSCYPTSPALSFCCHSNKDNSSFMRLNRTLPCLLWFFSLTWSSKAQLGLSAASPLVRKICMSLKTRTACHPSSFSDSDLRPFSCCKLPCKCL